MNDEIAARLIQAAARRGETGRAICAIAGESGAGKTTLALGIRAELQRAGLNAVVLHQDDYFRLPPQANHEARVRDLAWVGPGEVRLDRLEGDLAAFADGAPSLKVPRLTRPGDAFEDVQLDIGPARILLVEGTYSFLLPEVDLRVFLEGDYLHTEAARRARGRDPIDDFTNRILEIEHRIVREHRSRADVTVPVFQQLAGG